MVNCTVRQLHAELMQDAPPQQSSSKERKLEMEGALRIWKQSLEGLRRDSSPQDCARQGKNGTEKEMTNT